MTSSEDIKDEIFDFKAEAKEYVENGYVTHLDFKEIIPGIRAFLTVKTLEADVFEL